jgi:hypothetical protein
MSEEDFSIEWLLLEANIKEFAHKISIVCALEAGGKLTSSQAYEQIKDTWKRLKASRKALLGSTPPDAR